MLVGIEACERRGRVEIQASPSVERKIHFAEIGWKRSRKKKKKTEKKEIMLCFLQVDSVKCSKRTIWFCSSKRSERRSLSRLTGLKGTLRSSCIKWNRFGRTRKRSPT
jgi:hypothetical protein